MITYPKHILVSDNARKYLKTNFVVLTKGDGNAPAVIIDKNNPTINNKEIDLFSDENSSLKNSTKIFRHYGDNNFPLNQNIIQDFRISKYAKCLNPLCLIERFNSQLWTMSGNLVDYGLGPILATGSSRNDSKYLLIAPQEVALEDKLCELGYSINSELKAKGIEDISCDDPKTYDIQQEIINKYPKVEKYVNLVKNTVLKIKFVKAAEAFGQIPVLAV